MPGRCGGRVRIGAQMIGINNAISGPSRWTSQPRSGWPRWSAGDFGGGGVGHRRTPDVERLAAHADAFLVGSSLMRAADRARRHGRSAFGRVRSVGITDPADARMAACRGPLCRPMMVPNTPRAITLARPKRCRSGKGPSWSESSATRSRCKSRPTPGRSISTLCSSMATRMRAYIRRSARCCRRDGNLGRPERSATTSPAASRGRPPLFDSKVAGRSGWHQGCLRLVADREAGRPVERVLGRAERFECARRRARGRLRARRRSGVEMGAGRKMPQSSSPSSSAAAAGAGGAADI